MRLCLIAVAAVTIFAAGCDDDDDGTTADIGPDFVVTSTHSSNVTPGILDDGSGTPAGVITASAPAVELLALMDHGLVTAYRASYRTVSGDGVEGDGFTVYSLPPLNRVDTFAPGSAAPSSTLVAKAGGDTASCTPGAAGWDCVAIDSLGSSLIASAGPVIYPGASDLESSMVSEIAPREIAGQNTRCFDMVPASGPAGTYCVTADGVVLYNAGNFGTVEATTYSAEVTEEDFLLP